MMRDPLAFEKEAASSANDEYATYTLIGIQSHSGGTFKLVIHEKKKTKYE